MIIRISMYLIIVDDNYTINLNILVSAGITAAIITDNFHHKCTISSRNFIADGEGVAVIVPMG